MALTALALPVPESVPTRTPPHNLEAEQALLGALLVNNQSFDRVADFLKPDDFFEAIHGRIFETIEKLVRLDKLATPITVKGFIPDQDLGGMNVAQYLVRLAQSATTIINVPDYGRTIRDLSQRRRLIGIGEDIVNDAFDSPVEAKPSDQIEEAERKLYSLAEQSRYAGGFTAFSSATTIALDMAAKAFHRGDKLSGIASGLVDLDRAMGGLQRSDLIIVAGRPGMGKTALATNIAFNIANAYIPGTTADGQRRAEAGGIVGFFSLEMSSEQLATRVIAEQAGVPSSAIRRGEISDRDFEKLTDVVAKLQKLPLYIDQTGGISIAQLTARARRMKRQTGLDVLMVDYIQLLSASQRKSDNRVQEVTEITTGLKALAKELDVPIVALSQLSRQVESRDDKRPQLSDLRESGSIEQDADVVMFVFREEYYEKNREPKPGTDEHLTWQSKMDDIHGQAEVIIGKQRHGPTGSVKLQFDAEVTRFSNLAQSDRLPERR